MKKGLPYKKGYLKVSSIHKLYYELYGNPKGKPFVVLHGGPGGGSEPKMRKLFDLKKVNLVLFDQRGSGKSRPFADIQENTTWDLVEDIKKLLDFLKIKKAVFVGGSWGSTLALVYSIKYPKTVSGLILRGIFLGNTGDIDYLFGGELKTHFPDIWERFMGNVPKDKQRDIIGYYFKQMHSKNKKTSKKYLYEWARYEFSVLTLKPKTEKQMFKKFKYKAFSTIEAYYMKNNCFLSKNYIIKNLHKIRGIKMSIIHGRYDFVCPPEGAYILHKNHEKSKLFFVVAGHSSSEIEIKKKLKTEIKRFSR